MTVTVTVTLTVTLSLPLSLPLVSLPLALIPNHNPSLTPNLLT